MKYRAFGLTIASSVPLPELGRSSAGRPDISIGVAPTVIAAVAPDDWFHTWRGKDARGRGIRRPWLSFARTDTGYLLRFPDLADFEVSPAGDRICCVPTPRLARTTLRHLLLDQVLPLVIGRRGHLVLHASAVHVPGIGGVAFAGPTGCGKSTVAAALGLHGCPMLTDDCLVIAAVAGTRSIQPAYAGVRLWRKTARALGIGARANAVAHYTSKQRLTGARLPFRQRQSQLAAIVILGRRAAPGRPSQVSALGARDGLIALTPYTYVMDIGDRDQLSQVFNHLSSVATAVPVVRLRLRDEPPKPASLAQEVLDVVLDLVRGSEIDS
jgi:hypothetical protein